MAAFAPDAPCTSELHVFSKRRSPASEERLDAEEEEEGIQYVSNLQVVGGVLGIMMKASGDFVGTPTNGLGSRSNEARDLR